MEGWVIPLNFRFSSVLLRCPSDVTHVPFPLSVEVKGNGTILNRHVLEVTVEELSWEESVLSMGEEGTGRTSEIVVSREILDIGVK